MSPRDRSIATLSALIAMYRPDELRVAVVDYDTEGGDAADLTLLAQPAGRSTPACVREVVAEPAAILLDKVSAGRD